MTDDGGPLSRRTLLASAGVVAGVALAGCSDVSVPAQKDYVDESFAAAPVVLPGDGQEELRLAETTRDTTTEEYTVAGDTTVEMTNETAVYSRAAGLGGE